MLWRGSTCCRFVRARELPFRVEVPLSLHLTCFRPSGCLFTLGSPRAVRRGLRGRHDGARHHIQPVSPSLVPSPSLGMSCEDLTLVYDAGPRRVSTRSPMRVARWQCGSLLLVLCTAALPSGTRAALTLNDLIAGMSGRGSREGAPRVAASRTQPSGLPLGLPDPAERWIQVSSLPA